MKINKFDNFEKMSIDEMNKVNGGGLGTSWQSSGGAGYDRWYLFKRKNTSTLDGEGDPDGHMDYM